jgi:hypothetical protein
MKSANLEIPRKEWHAPARLSGIAEAYVHSDPCPEGPTPNPGEPTL